MLVVSSNIISLSSQGVQHRKNHIALGVILVLGFILRLIASVSHSYSSDELSAITRLNYNSFADLFEFGVKTGDMHPAGVQVFMKFWSMLFGTSEFAMRFPFVVLGTLSIFLIYQIGKRWSAETGLFAAGLWSVLLFPIIQSELARPYSPGLFFTLLTALFLLRFLFNLLSRKQYWQNAVLLSISLFGAMITHYFAFLAVGFMSISALLFIPKKAVIPYISSGIIACLLFLPHLSITLYQTGIEDGLQWLSPPHKWWLSEFIFFSFNESWIVFSCVAITFILAISRQYHAVKNISKPSLLLIIWFFGTYLLGHILSHSFTPILKFPVMVFVLPFFLLALAQFINPFNKASRYVVSFALICLTLLSTITEKKVFSNIHFEVFKELSNHIRQWEKTIGEQKATMILNISNPNYINFYARQTGEAFDLDLDMIKYGDAAILESVLLSSSHTYLVIGFSGRNTPIQFLNQSLKYFPNLVDYYQYNNSAIFLLSKHRSNADLNFEKHQSYSLMNRRADWGFELTKMDTVYHLYKADSSSRYEPQIRIPLNKSLAENKHFLKVTVQGSVSAHNEVTIVAIPEDRHGAAVLNNYCDPIWMGLDIETDLLNRNQGSFAFSLPPQTPANGSVNIYIWNRNKQAFIINDVEIDVISNIWNN